jgi:hypothetical protein
LWIEINADSLLPVPDIRSGMESYRKFIGISKISAYGILKSATMNRKLSGRYAATWYGAARALR